MPRKILCVDDNTHMEEQYRRMLEPDYEVLFASSGAEAVGMAKRELPDAVVLDTDLIGDSGISMDNPFSSGYKVHDMLRTDPTTEGIRVIGTAYFFTENMTSYCSTTWERRGASFIPKNALYPCLREKLKELLG